MKHLIVTHHAPDTDAIGATWLLKRFDNQHYADAQFAFTDPGTQINPSEAERLGFQMHEVTHVDTGLGEFDHHQAERGQQRICASSLVYDHLCQIHPELKSDAALKALVEFITGTDHFDEIYWPEPNSLRYSFILPELLHGYESHDPHNDESQMQFGFTCFDCAYASLNDNIQAAEEMKTGQEFQIKAGKCLGLETRNDAVVKYSQKAGYAVVIRKDSKNGEIRIKARPDADIDLKALSERITKLDQVGSWFYHQSGKMLINGSRKQRHQRPSPLALQTVIDLMKELYA